MTLTTIAAALYPGPMEVQPQVSNPFGIEGAEGFLKPILDLFFPLMGIASVLASASVVLRFRRAKGEERLQLKWFAYAVALLATYFAIDVVVEGPLGGNIGAVSQAIAFTLVFAIPISVGVAILKYRLYDIDLLINRTLVYVPLTAIIAGTYIAAITLFRSLFVGLTGQNSDAAIVLTTLVVAAAFTPVKNWLQTVVDRRFKEVSDPTKNLSAFREQLRSVVQVLKAEQVAQRFLHEAASAFGAECGAVYLSQNGQEERVYMYGSVTVENALTIPIEYEGSRLGSIVLGPRRNGLAYTAQDGEALRKTAKIVAEAVSLTRVDARHLPLDPAAITR